MQQSCNPQETLMPNKPQQSLRILMIIHAPWDRNLGAPRVQMQLAEEFEKLGHKVEKFDLHDAFPNPPRSRLWRLIQTNAFSSRAASFVRRNGHRFDVIDANQGDLPSSKKALGFSGLLVSRSNGLYAFYEEFNRFERIKWPQPKSLKTVIGLVLTNIAGISTRRNPLQSLINADLITLLNRDEFVYVDKNLGLGYKSELIPNGLSEKQFENLLPSQSLVRERWSKRTILFIGGWCPRKGSRDWGAIVRFVRSEIPDARFHFLGTGLSEAEVLRDLGMSACDWIRVVSSFDSSNLSQLLNDVTIGAFPSYIEGFPFGVLEKLAAGLPVVAYNVPGPRAMLRDLAFNLMVEVGDTKNMASRLVSLLLLDVEDYIKLSAECRALAHRFRWVNIASMTMQAYRNRIEKLQLK
jgi:glycosyltransferase involved in cell wall biosynthesis